MLQAGSLTADWHPLASKDPAASDHSFLKTIVLMKVVKRRV